MAKSNPLIRLYNNQGSKREKKSPTGNSKNKEIILLKKSLRIALDRLEELKEDRIINKIVGVLKDENH